MTRTEGPYIIGQPGGPSGPFYSLINQHGRVVAMQIPNKADATALSANPDLLAACEFVMDHAGEYLREEWAGDWLSLRDALAKAKGASS